jgi:transcriptional regulator with XRE-family HTH domain
MLRVKEICKERGVTVQELAENKLGITYQALYESINGNPSLKRLQQIAAALDVEVAELFEKPVSGAITCPSCGTEIKLTAEKV